MAKNINRKVTIYINGKEVENTLKGMKAELNKLQNEQRRATLGSREYIETTEKINTLKRYIKEQTESVDSLGGKWEGAADKLAKYANILMGVQSAFQMLDMGIGKLKDLSKDAAALDDVYADVMKTTGLTHEQVEDLNKAFLKMDTRTSREQLNQLAYEAGKLGINSEEAVKQFVSASDKINIALGDVLGEGAMVTVGKLTNIYEGVSKTLDGKNLEEKMLAIGSAVNSLGQASTANEGYMVEFMKRLGGIAAQAGLSADQVLGYASALDQNGQAVEMSATAFMKLIQQMVKKPQEFVAAAGVSMEDFKKMMDEDMNGAVMRVLEGMEKGGGFQQLIGMFADMGLDGARAATVVSSLAKHLDQVREAQALANQEMMTGSSVINEFNTKNDTMQAKAEKAKKRFEEVRIELGNNLYPILIHLQKSGTVLLKGFSGLVQVCKENKAVLVGLIAVSLNQLRVTMMSHLSGQKLIATAKSLLGINKLQSHQTDINTAKEARAIKVKEAARLATIKEQLAINKKILAQKSDYISKGAINLVYAAERNEKALSIALTNQEIIATKASTAAANARKAAMLSTPWGLIIAGLTAVSALTIKLIKSNKEATKATDNLKQAVSAETTQADLLFSQLGYCTKGTEEYKRILNQLNQLYPEIIQNYKNENGELVSIEAAHRAVISAIKDETTAKMRAERANELSQEYAETEIKAYEKIRELADKEFGEKGPARFQSFSDALKKNMSKDRDEFVKSMDIITKLWGHKDQGSNFASDPYTTQFTKIYDAYHKMTKEMEDYDQVINAIIGKQFNAKSSSVIQNGSQGDIETDTGKQETSLIVDPKAAKKAADEWENVKIRVDKMVAESALKASSGLKKVNDEIVVRFENMRKEVRDAATEAGVSADEEIRKLDDAEAALKRAKIDEYIKKMSDEYAKMSSNVKSSEVDENIAKVEQAAKKLQEELSSIDGAIATLSSDAENASAEDKNKIDELIASYRKLKSEITNAAFSNILDNAQASPINKRDKSNWSSSTQSKVQSRTNSLGMFFDKSSFEAYGNALEEINKKYEAQKKKLSSLSLAEDAVISELEKRISLESDPEEQNALKQSIADHKARKEVIAGEVEKLEEYKDEAEQIADEDAFGPMLEQWIHGIEEFSKSVLDIFSGINTILDNIGDRELKEQEERKDNGIKALDDELQQGLISQEEYEEEKEAIEEDYDEKEKAIKLEQWKRGKALSISQATIDGALAVLKALASAPPPYNAILAAAAGVAAGVQIAAIASEPAPYAKGGYIDNKKYIVAGEAGREWIASNRLLNDPATAPMISALEQYQRGNRRAMTDIPMAAINMPMAMEAAKEIGRRQYNPQTVVLDESRRNVASIASDNNEMVAVMKELASYLKDPNNRRAVISRQSMIDFENKENFLRSRASL